MGMHIPLEVIDLLEERLGREEGRKVAGAIEAALEAFETRSFELATQRKIEVWEELHQEMREVLATKEDLANLRAELKEDIAQVRQELGGVQSELKEDITALSTSMIGLEARMGKFAQLDKKFTVLWLVTLFVIVFLNQNALEFLAHLLGLMK